MKYIEAVTRTFSERCSDNFKKTTGKNFLNMKENDCFDDKIAAHK